MLALALQERAALAAPQEGQAQDISGCGQPAPMQHVRTRPAGFRGPLVRRLRHWLGDGRGTAASTATHIVANLVATGMLVASI